MKKLSKALLSASIIPFSLMASEQPIKIGEAYDNIKAKYGIPEKITIYQDSASGHKTEVAKFKGLSSLYVFNANQGTTMDLQKKPEFKVCNIVITPIENHQYSCTHNDTE